MRNMGGALAAHLRVALILLVTACALVDGQNATYWAVTSGSSYCSVIGSHSNCVTDGPGDYGNNEDCVMVAQQVGVPSVSCSVPLVGSMT